MTALSEPAAGARRDFTPAARTPRLARPAQRGRYVPFAQSFHLWQHEDL